MSKTAENGPANYVLVDFENVQPENLELLADHPVKVYVFVGASQTKLPIHIVKAMQARGARGEYIQISGSGKNALDFHIAFYIGQLAANDPTAHFHVISKDKGFDPLINHLKGRNIHIQRFKDLTSIPTLRIPTRSSTDEKISAIVKILIGLGQSRPRKVKTLQNTINNHFTEELGQPELAVLLKELRKRKLIVVNNNNVSYKLPS